MRHDGVAGRCRDREACARCSLGMQHRGSSRGAVVRCGDAAAPYCTAGDRQSSPAHPCCRTKCRCGGEGAADSATTSLYACEFFATRQ